MREIKFRAWNTKKRYMDDGSNSFIFDCYDMYPECIMQFTGLTDKNGKEIYDGDILGHPFRSPMVVEWGYCSDGEYETDCHGWIGNQDWHERTVIGNIYENAELLEEKPE